MKLKYCFFVAIIVLFFGCGENPKKSNFSSDSQMIRCASHVLNRVLGEKAKSVKLEIYQMDDGVDSYEYSCKKGILKVKGTSVTALTRGVYDYLKDNNMGMLDWSGPLFNLPEKWPDAKPCRVTSPYKIRHAFNVVTSGYTTPYWTWERWEKELDWQAMHGFNMMMAPVATEAIAARVWKKLGLEQHEIDSFFVGPAHLPWLRMGNITNVGGSLPYEWHNEQINLQHKILKRMRELGIEPIVQSFAGFVPKQLKRIYPDIVLHNTLWNQGFPKEQRPVFIMPDDELFGKISKMFIKEWKQEFGDADYYLVDSFNELKLPKTNKSLEDLLADYGEKTYRYIKNADSDAIWVIQGWMFAYQRDIWNPQTVKALFSRVPDDEVLILDYANDYNNNWQPMNAFNGKQWVYGFVPNMGGKTAYTGDMSLYASGAAKAINSQEKKNLVGFTISGEGLENNAVIYELLTDVAWTSDSINLDLWLTKFSKNRYGSCPESITESWKLLRESCYSHLVPHPQFGWQLGRCGMGTVNNNPKFHEATLKFLSCSDKLDNSKAYCADAIERAALSLGLIADEWFTEAAEEYKNGNVKKGDVAGKKGLDILLYIDRLMESHPLNRLERWINFAEKHTENKSLKKFYVANAKQIITVWGPPVNDYSCRVWSGLIRDFYYPRMEYVLEAIKNKKKFDSVKWEKEWVYNNKSVSEIEKYDDAVNMAKELVKDALNDKK